MTSGRRPAGSAPAGAATKPRAARATPGAPFDRYLEGDAKALSPVQREGLALFMAKGCAACHGGRNLGGDAYYPFGVVAAPAADVRPAGDTGRFKVTSTESDRYAFRSPALRNVAVTQPYFHSGAVWNLRDAVKVMGSAQLGVALADGEADRITEFLKALTGRQPQLEYPVLPAGTDGTPKPELEIGKG